MKLTVFDIAYHSHDLFLPIKSFIYNEISKIFSIVTSNGGCRHEENSRKRWSLFTKLLYLVTSNLFLVAYYATLHPALLVGRSVGWLVSQSVGRSPLYSFGVFELFEHMAPAQMPWGPPALLLPTHTRLG